MDKQLYNSYVKILESELIPALGCTEPGAVALAACQAALLLKEEVTSMDIWCSGNIVKNVKGVIVPNSGGMRGIDAAAILGALVADRYNDGETLEVLNHLENKDIQKANILINTNFCTCHLEEDKPNLYIKVKAVSKNHVSEVVIKDSHTNICMKSLDGKIILADSSISSKSDLDNLKSLLSIENILIFADNLNEEDGMNLFCEQIKSNVAIADEGLQNNYGACVGQTVLSTRENGVKTRAVAKAAAGSDARMNGCIMPVVINSGSGNQGITVTVPVVEYAKEINASPIELYRALAVSNLVSIHIKSHIGKLSAFCGAVSAACGTGCGIAYLNNASYEKICSTISNTLGNVGGIVCDGAKASCAAKIVSSLDAAILGYDMAQAELKFQAGEGLIMDDIEETIDNIGMVGKYGMKNTDIEILHLMLGERDYICD